MIVGEHFSVAASEFDEDVLNTDPVTRLGGVNLTGKVPTKFTVDRVAGNGVLQFRDVHDKKP